MAHSTIQIRVQFCIDYTSQEHVLRDNLDTSLGVACISGDFY